MPKRVSPEARHRQKKRYYSRTAFAENGWNRWTENEIDIVMKHEIPDREISKLLGRSVTAIQLMRCKEKKGEKV